MGKGRIKRILILYRFEFIDKGEGRHKRIQAVSPLFFWKREKRDTKRIQAVSPWRILFGKGRRDEKNEEHKFSRFRKPKNFGKLLAQGRRRRRISSKRLRNQCGKIACIKNELEKIDVYND